MKLFVDDLLKEKLEATVRTISMQNLRQEYQKTWTKLELQFGP